MKLAFITMNAMMTATRPGLLNISSLMTGSSTLLSHTIMPTRAISDIGMVTAVVPSKPWVGRASMLYRPVAMAMKSNNAPTRSKRPLEDTSSAGTTLAERARPMIPIGTLMKNIQCQDRVSVSIPPMTGPNAEPDDEPSTDTDIPNAMIFAGRNFTASMRHEDASMAAPTPWTALNSMRDP